MKYTFDELKHYILKGNIIQFYLEEDEYVITHNKITYAVMPSEGEYQVFYSPQDLIDGVRIDGRTLEEVWEDVEFYEIF